MKKLLVMCVALCAVVTSHASTIDMDLALDNTFEPTLYSQTSTGDEVVDMLLDSYNPSANVGKDNYLNYSAVTVGMKSPEIGYNMENRYNAGYFQNLFSMESNPGVKPYEFWDEMTYAGFPLFAAGLLIKSEKKSFRQDYNNAKGVQGRLLTDFKTRIDDYTQLVPFGVATVLNLAGYEGRSKTARYAVSAGLSYAFMAGFVNSIKYTAKEMRPDGSTANSFPSGHTATAFVSATILHKEYGLTRSPWFSVGGYALATGTGICRVLNNRHWVSDVFAGAGIGILSAELAYGISDLIFKGKGLNRGYLNADENVIYNPSYFSLSMGVGLGSRNMSFDASNFFYEDIVEASGSNTIDLKFQPGTAVGVEGAYFFNTYVGIGGRLRVLSSSINGWGNVFAMSSDDINETINYLDFSENSFLSNTKMTIESDHLTEFSGDLGVYFNFPLSSRFALGTKFLVGRSIMQALQISAESTGTEHRCDAKWDMDSDGLFVNTSNEREGNVVSATWDYLTLNANNTMKYGTGISLTYAANHNVSWKLFVDYDYSRKTYTLEMDETPTYKLGIPDIYNLLVETFDEDMYELVHTESIKKHVNRFVIGGAFCITL